MKFYQRKKTSSSTSTKSLSKEEKPITEQEQEVDHSEDLLLKSSNEAEFDSFFKEVLKKFPKKTAAVIQNSLAATKQQAEKLVAKQQAEYEPIFREFLTNVSKEQQKKSHQIIHAAALSAAIIGFSPIPFSDAALLVPVQLVMMARLHKVFGQSWTEGIAKSVGKEIIVVGFGRSVVGNMLKFVPGVGTVAGGAINATVALTITEVMGWVTVNMLANGQDLFDQAMSFKGQFDFLMGMVKQVKHKKNG
ncbi:YcjF family protein [Enterococcus bulliens]